MAEHGTVARPYAQAVFEIAKAAGELPAWSEFLKLAAVMVTEPDVKRMLFTPGADLTRLAVAIADLCREQLGNPAPLSAGERSPGANFLKVLADNQRLECPARHLCALRRAQGGGREHAGGHADQRSGGQRRAGGRASRSR